MPLGVVLRKTPGVTRWAKWSWRAVAVIPGAGAADWRLLRTDGDSSEFHAATSFLELHGAECEAYLTGLSDNIPSIYIVMREVESLDNPFEILLVTASPYSAQDYADNGEDIVEKVPMTEGLIAWIRDFAQSYHQEEVFVKRRRDRQRVDGDEAGIGDARIKQLTDVYRAPSKTRSKEPIQ